MSRSARALVVALVAVAVALVVSAAAPGLLFATGGYHPATGTATPSDGYGRATVRVVDDATNETLGTVRVAVADTPEERYTGLSKTDHLPPNRGMLFVYDEPGRHTYVMRGMSFGIDIVYVGANGTITRIYHAPEPPEGADGEEYEYPGYGQYVLEVPYEWTDRHDVQAGDRVVVSGL